MRPRRVVLLAAFVLAVGAAAAMTFAVTRSSGGGPGPLDLRMDGIGMGMSWNLGESFSVSVPWVIRNTSDHELVLDGIKAVGVRHGSLEVLGAYVMPLAHRESRLSFPGYRVPVFGQALPGAVIGPHAQLQLVFGLKATAPGRHTFTAMKVLYHEGSTSYVARAGLEVAVCSPNNIHRDCPDPLWAGADL